MNKHIPSKEKNTNACIDAYLPLLEEYDRSIIVDAFKTFPIVKENDRNLTTITFDGETRAIRDEVQYLILSFMYKCMDKKKSEILIECNGNNFEKVMEPLLTSRKIDPKVFMGTYIKNGEDK